MDYFNIKENKGKVLLCDIRFIFSRIKGGDDVLPQNISEKNSFVRMICGIALVSFGTARIARNSDCLIGTAMIIGGAMKVAEGSYQYCPLTELVANNTEGEQHGFKYELK